MTTVVLLGGFAAYSMPSFVAMLVLIVIASFLWNYVGATSLSLFKEKIFFGEVIGVLIGLALKVIYESWLVHLIIIILVAFSVAFFKKTLSSRPFVVAALLGLMIMSALQIVELAIIHELFFKGGI